MELTPRLSDLEKRALLKLSTMLAMKDGELAESEVGPLRELASQAGVAVEDVFTSVLGANIEDLCKDISRPAAARIAVAELLRLAYRDEVYKSVERDTIAKVAQAVGLDDATLEAIESWVQRGFEWEREADELLLL